MDRSYANTASRPFGLDSAVLDSKGGKRLWVSVWGHATIAIRIIFVFIIITTLHPALQLLLPGARSSDNPGWKRRDDMMRYSERTTVCLTQRETNYYQAVQRRVCTVIPIPFRFAILSLRGFPDCKCQHPNLKLSHPPCEINNIPFFQPISSCRIAHPGPFRLGLIPLTDCG